MKITKNLVKHLLTLGLDAKHADEKTFVEAEVKSFAASKLMDGSLSVEDITRLTVEAEAQKANATINELVTAAVGSQFKSFSEMLTKQLGEQIAASRQAVGLEAKAHGVSGTDLFAGAAGGDGSQLGGDGEIRVKQAVERYQHNRTALLYSKSTNVHNRLNGDSPVRFGQEQATIDELTPRDKAIANAWVKRLMGKAAARHRGGQVPQNLQLTDHEKDLVNWTARNSEFVGPAGRRMKSEDGDEVAEFNFNRQKAVSDLEVKALLDDSTSGGLEAVPIEFDNMVIMSAILNGELFPLVDWQTVNRRRMEGYSMSTFTFSNTAEGTAITPFTTTSFIAAFDTTIYPVVGAVEIGLDFLDDAPVNIAGQVQTRYADGFLKHMDDKIAAGSGTNEITGLFTTSGLNNIDASSGSLPYKTADAENLLFGVAKAYRDGVNKNRQVFLSNDLVYKRMRQIPWSTETNLRVFGTQSYEDYMLLGHPYKINEAVATPNAKAGFFCMNWFRGYRRAGFQVTVEAGGQTNRLKNIETIVVRARYGGQLSLAAAGCLIDDLPTS